MGPYWALSLLPTLKNFGDILKMFGTSWECWGHPENVGDNLNMLGTIWKCWGQPENVGDILKMLGTIWKCWGQTENVGDNLKMLGTSWKCWGHPENVGDKLKMLGTNWKCSVSSTSPLLLHPFVGRQNRALNRETTKSTDFKLFNYFCYRNRPGIPPLD